MDQRFSRLKNSLNLGLIGFCNGNGISLPAQRFYTAIIYNDYFPVCITLTDNTIDCSVDGVFFIVVGYYN